MDYKHLVTTNLSWDPKHWFQCDMSLNKATSKVSTCCFKQGIQPTENKHKFKLPVLKFSAQNPQQYTST